MNQEQVVDKFGIDGLINPIFTQFIFLTIQLFKNIIVMNLLNY